MTEREEVTCIIGHITDTPDGEVITYTWNGPVDGIVWISASLVEHRPEWIANLPWQLTQVGPCDELRSVYPFQRMDTEQPHDRT